MNSTEKWVRQCLGKKRYRTDGFAKKIAEKIKGDRGTELFIYRCPCCQGFHLTKKQDFRKPHETQRIG